jgi:hypothetical protein
MSTSPLKIKVGDSQCATPKNELGDWTISLLIEKQYSNDNITNAQHYLEYSKSEKQSFYQQTSSSFFSAPINYVKSHSGTDTQKSK